MNNLALSKSVRPHIATPIDLIPAFLKAAYGYTEYNSIRIDANDIPHLLTLEDITQPDKGSSDLIAPYNKLLTSFGDYAATSLEVTLRSEDLIRVGAANFIKVHGRACYYFGSRFDEAKAALISYPRENASDDISLTWRLASLGHQIATGRTADKGSHPWLRSQPSTRGNQEGLMDELRLSVKQKLRDITGLKAALLEHNK